MTLVVLSSCQRLPRPVAPAWPLRAGDSLLCRHPQRPLARTGDPRGLNAPHAATTGTAARAATPATRGRDDLQLSTPQPPPQPQTSPPQLAQDQSMPP